MEFDLYWWFCVRVLFFSQESSGEKKEYLFKVLVIGDLGVGKTSIIKRYVHQFFSVHYRATISFARFKSTWKFSDLLCTSNLIIRLRMSRKSHLWDTSYCCDTHSHQTGLHIIWDTVLFVYYFNFTRRMCLSTFCFCLCLLALRNNPHCFFLFTFFLTIHTLEWTSH